MCNWCHLSLPPPPAGDATVLPVLTVRMSRVKGTAEHLHSTTSQGIPDRRRSHHAAEMTANSTAAMAAYTAAFLAAAAPASASAAAANPPPTLPDLPSEKSKANDASQPTAVAATASRPISREAVEVAVRAVLQQPNASAPVEASLDSSNAPAPAPAAAASSPMPLRHSLRSAALVAAAGAAAAASHPAAAAASSSVPPASDSAASSAAANVPADVEYEEDEKQETLFFKAPSGGLVHNKPFSWELRGAIYSTLPADPIALANAEPLASVRFNLAVKEKRTNAYEPKDAVWVKAADPSTAASPAETSAAKLLSITRLVDAANTDDVDSAPSSPGSATSEQIASKLLKRSFHLGSKTSDRKPQHVQCAPTPLSRLTKTAREKARDRSIGQAAIITTEPAASLMASGAARSLANLQTKLFVRITAVKQTDKRGLLTLVTTKGGNIQARNSQRYILIQAGFGYKILQPRMPPGYAIRFNSLQLRSWEQAITPIPLLETPRLLTLFPTIKPKQRKSSKSRRSGSSTKRVVSTAMSVASGDSNSSYNANGDTKPAAEGASAAAAPSRRTSRLRAKKKRASSSSSDTESDDDVMSDLTDDSEGEGASRRKRKHKKSHNSKRSVATAADGVVPSLGALPTRHNRSLTALLQVVEDAETTKAGGGLLVGATKFDNSRKRPAPAARNEPGNAAPASAAPAAGALSPAKARVAAATDAMIAVASAAVALAPRSTKKQRSKKQKTVATSTAEKSSSLGSSVPVTAAAVAAASSSSMMDAAAVGMPSSLSLAGLSNPAWLVPFRLAPTHRAMEELPQQGLSLLPSHLPPLLQIGHQPPLSSPHRHHASTETEFPPPTSPVGRSLHHLSTVALEGNGGGGGSGSSSHALSSYRGSGSGVGREMLTLSPHPQTPPQASPQPPHSVSPPRMLGLSRHSPQSHAHAPAAAASGMLSPHHRTAAASSHFAPSAPSSRSFTFAGAYRVHPMTPIENAAAAAASSWPHHLQQQPSARNPFDSASPPAPHIQHSLPLPLLASPLPPAHPDPASPHQHLPHLGSSTPPHMAHPLQAPHTPMPQLDIGEAAAAHSNAAQVCTESFLN